MNLDKKGRTEKVYVPKKKPDHQHEKKKRAFIIARFFPLFYRLCIR